MSNEIKHNDVPKQGDIVIGINIQGLGLRRSNIKWCKLIILCIVWIALGGGILSGIYIVFNAGGFDDSQMTSLIPIEILHYYLILKIVCVLAMCFSLLGLYALYCHFAHCSARENVKIEGMRRDILLKAFELSGKIVAQEVKPNRKNETHMFIHYQSDCIPKEAEKVEVSKTYEGVKMKKLIDILGPQRWGYLRETATQAKTARTDSLTGLHRTGLEEYLEVIFPDVQDWIHDEVFSREEVPSVVPYRRFRPDYRSVSHKYIVEFDGIQHYTKERTIKKDEEKDSWYKSLGYKVFRIPYFIQLTNKAVKTIFDKDVGEELFNGAFPSLGAISSSPVNFCDEGIKRMAHEMAKFPEQYEVNMESLNKQKDKYVRKLQMLESEYKKAIKAIGENVK